MLTRCLVAGILALSLLSGCKNSCQQLSEKLCDCTINSVERTNCLQRVSSKAALSEPTDADEATCEALYDECDCRLIDTPQGKVRCGLALPPGA